MVQFGEKDQGCKMISVLKEYPKANNCVTKSQYEQKNSSVNLKDGFKDNKDLSQIFLNFKDKLDTQKDKYVSQYLEVQIVYLLLP